MTNKTLTTDTTFDSFVNLNIAKNKNIRSTLQIIDSLSDCATQSECTQNKTEFCLSCFAASELMNYADCLLDLKSGEMSLFDHLDYSRRIINNKKYLKQACKQNEKT
jgi:hypothetical protein